MTTTPCGGEKREKFVSMKDDKSKQLYNENNDTRSLQDLRSDILSNETIADLGLGTKFLDISGLRPEVQKIANDIARDFDCHRDKVIISMIAAVCAVVGKKARVPYRHFFNRCAVYAMIVDYKGGIKSSVSNYVLRPVVQIDKQMRDAYNARVASASPDAKIGPLPTIYSRGVTSEEKHRLLSASPAGLLVHKDEISVYYKQRDKYNNKKDTGEAQEDCSLFDGTSQAPDRVGDTLKLSNTDVAYSIFGSTTTPEFAKNFTTFFTSETGEYDRYLFVKTDWRPRHHEDYDETLYSDPKEWETVINDLHNMPSDRLYIMEKAAKKLYVDYKNKECIDAINKDPNYEHFLTGYKQRNATYLLRLALIFHLLNDWHSDTITASEMQMAINCMRVFNQYAESCYQLILDAKNKKNDSEKKSAAEKIRDAFLNNHELGRPIKAINQSHLARELGVSQAAVGKELRKLRESGLLGEGVIVTEEVEVPISPEDHETLVVDKEAQSGVSEMKTEESHSLSTNRPMSVEDGDKNKIEQPETKDGEVPP